MNKTCDLHMHTVHSDGLDTISEILVNAEKSGASAISITDHNTIEGLFEVEKVIKANKLFSGHIISGCEFCAICYNMPIEILGYGFNIEKMKKYTRKMVPLSAYDQYRYKKIIKMFKKIDKTFKAPTTSELVTNKSGNFDMCKSVYDKGLKNKKIYDELEKTNPEFVKIYKNFFRNGLNNVHSKFFIKIPYRLMPHFKKIIKVINKYGGVASLAHPMEYKDNYMNVMKTIAPFTDGIECYHPSAGEHFKEILEFTENHNLLVTGGSDYHTFKNELNMMKMPYDKFEKIYELTKDTPNSLLK